MVKFLAFVLALIVPFIVLALAIDCLRAGIKGKFEPWALRFLGKSFRWLGGQCFVLLGRGAQALGRKIIP